MMLSLLVFAGCEERNPPLFDDISGVYFKNVSATMMHVDSLDLTFVYEASDMMEVPVRVQLLGRPADKDRRVKITAYSDNALPGMDYILPDHAVLPAGESGFDYVVSLMRTPALKKEKKSIELVIQENDDFSLPVTEMVQLGDTVSTISFRIFFSDMFTKAPAAWDVNLMGAFSQQKFELICRVLDIDPADFNDPAIITLAKQLYISVEMTGYVDEEVAKKEEGLDYDEEIIDKATGLPLNFGR